MNLVSDILTYIRRIIKSPSNAVISDALLIDYLNRFYISDVDARVQLFDLKTKYQFQTAPGVDRYNMPLYNIQTEPGSQTIAAYPVYQGFTGNAFVQGVRVAFYTQRETFFDLWNNYVQPLQTIAVGDGTVGPYQLTIPFSSNQSVSVNPQPSTLARGHIDMAGIIAIGANPIVDPPLSNTFLTTVPVTSVSSAVYFTSTDATGANVVVCDSGQFLTGAVNNGLLMSQGSAPFGNTALSGGYSTSLNTINYLTGVANVTFPVAIPAGQNINCQCYYISPGLPRALLFYNNTITLRSIPATQYLVELDAYLSPAAFLSTSSGIQFGYMAEYLARGAARKILSDTGDVEQFMFYEPLFKEQEMLVWKRSQRQFTSTRTQTIFSQTGLGLNNNNFMGQGTN